MYKDKIKKNINQIPFLTYNVEGNNDSVSQIITFYTWDNNSTKCKINWEVCY